jgi:hypothetical protein
MWLHCLTPPPPCCLQVVAQLQERLAQLQQELNEAHTTVADSLKRLHQQQEQQRAALEAKFDSERQRLRKELAELRAAAGVEGGASPRGEGAGSSRPGTGSGERGAGAAAAAASPRV